MSIFLYVIFAMLIVGGTVLLLFAVDSFRNRDVLLGCVLLCWGAIVVVASIYAIVILALPEETSNILIKK